MMTPENAEEMSRESTTAAVQGYLDALLARTDFRGFLAEDATFEIVGAPPVVHGSDAIQGTIMWLHTQAFDARPKLRTLVTGDDQAAVEADFVGTHIGEYLGVTPTGKPVDVPYSVFYDVSGDKITALRLYMPMEVLMRQIQEAG
jgi:predicted ester cyclase